MFSIVRIPVLYAKKKKKKKKKTQKEATSSTIFSNILEIPNRGRFSK